MRDADEATQVEQFLILAKINEFRDIQGLRRPDVERLLEQSPLSAGTQSRLLLALDPYFYVGRGITVDTAQTQAQELASLRRCLYWIIF